MCGRHFCDSEHILINLILFVHVLFFFFFCYLGKKKKSLKSISISSSFVKGGGEVGDVEGRLVSDVEVSSLGEDLLD